MLNDLTILVILSEVPFMLWNGCNDLILFVLLICLFRSWSKRACDDVLYQGFCVVVNSKHLLQKF
jgi:hypothetical protein